MNIFCTRKNAFSGSQSYVCSVHRLAILSIPNGAQNAWFYLPINIHYPFLKNAH